MEGKRVNRIPPFAPGLIWYAERLKGDSFPASRQRDLARCEIAGNNEKKLMLTIPLEGGAGVLKHNLPVEKFRLSDHGNWRHTHLHALEASYGKAPYFGELMSRIEEVYNDDFILLKDFNIAIDRVCWSFLTRDRNPILLKKEFLADEAPLARGEEILAGLNASLSIIDALMRLGPETLLGIMAHIYPEYH